MKLTIFGATGNVGRHLVPLALAQGHQVTAFTRDPARISVVHERLRVLQGDVTDPASCLPAVEGADAVVVVLGAGRQGRIRESGTSAVVAAMQEAGVDRLICQSTIGVGSSRGNLNFYWKHLMFGLLLRPAFADHVRQEHVVRDSALDWTIVRPSAFAETSPGTVRHGFGPSEPGLHLKISLSDLAEFLLALVDDPRYSRDAVTVSA